MDVISHCALRVVGFEWQPRAGSHAFTVVCKATFSLRPERSVLAPQQELPNDEDEHWNDDPARSVRAPSDRAPYKPKADVVLVGSAFAPQQKPVRSFTVRLVAGPLDKSIEVWCDRAVRPHDGQLLESARIAKMPLRWERAAGGPDTQNPSGLRFDAPPDRYGSVAIANLQPVGMHFAGLGDTFAPICFGPIAPRWPGRMLRLHRHAATFAHRGWESRPLPEDFDYAYFNMAPPDQQLSALVLGERLLLENLHHEHPRLVTALPSIQPRAVLARATGEQEQIAMVPDTLWIDTDRGICAVVWRGRVGLRHPHEAGRIAVTMETPVGMPAPYDEDAGQTLAPGLIGEEALPFVGPAAAGRPAAPAPKGDDALPFGRDGVAAPRGFEASMGALAGETVFAVPAASGPSMPAVAPSPAPPPLVRAMEPVPPPPVGAISPPMPSPVEAPPPPGGSLSIGQRVAGGVSLDGPGRMHDKAGGVSSIPVHREQEDGLSAKDVVAGGAAAASNAAAQAAGRALPGRLLSGRAPVELVWLQAGVTARIRKQAAWKDLLAGAKPRPEDEDLDDDLPPARRIPAKDRREVMAVLSRGEPLDAMAVEDALRRAMEEEDGFFPPLVLAAGELEMRFDELESLKALLAALSPHVSGERRLEEAVSRVQEAFKMPWTQGASGVLDEMAENLRRLFAEVRKGAQGDVAEGHVERALLEGRHYRKRTVFGQPRLVGALTSPGMKAVVPVYLPDTLAKDLPSMRRMPVRLIAEVRPRAEQSEPSPAALRAVAVGRVLGAGW